MQDVVETKARDALKVTEVTCDEFWIVIDGCRRDLRVGVREGVAIALEIGADLPEDPRDWEVVLQSGHRRQSMVLDVSEVAFSSSRAVRALEELTDGNSAGELGITRDLAEPVHVGLKRARSEHLRDCVGIEEVGQGIQSSEGPLRLPTRDDVSKIRTRSSESSQPPATLASPPSGPAVRSRWRVSNCSGPTMAAYGPAMPSDDHWLTPLGATHVLTESGLHLGNRTFFGHVGPPLHVLVNMTAMTMSARGQAGFWTGRAGGPQQQIRNGVPPVRKR